MDEIECPDCEGHGWTHGGLTECTACKGKGWREPTEEEANTLAEAAYDRQFEDEPPMSFAERTEMQAKRDAQWGAA
jgi:RecJ-like exonuclease